MKNISLVLAFVGGMMVGNAATMLLMNNADRRHYPDGPYGGDLTIYLEPDMLIDSFEIPCYAGCDGAWVAAIVLSQTEFNIFTFAPIAEDISDIPVGSLICFQGGLDYACSIIKSVSGWVVMTVDPPAFTVVSGDLVRIFARPDEASDD